MYKQLLSGALGAILLGLICAEASVSGINTIPSASVVLAWQREASVHKFADGGIQFTVPAGWDVKSEKDTVKVFPEGHNAQIAFVSLIPMDLNSDQRESLFNSLLEKAGITDMTLDVYHDSESLGGMRVASRFYKGKIKEQDVAGMFFLLRGDKYVFITVVAAKSEADTYQELEAVINSIKKID